MSSAGTRRATASATAVLPEAVGPKIASTRGTARIVVDEGARRSADALAQSLLGHREGDDAPVAVPVDGPHAEEVVVLGDALHGEASHVPDRDRVLPVRHVRVAVDDL